MSARFVSPTSNPSPNAFSAQGKYYEYRSFDAETEAALYEEADRFFIFEEGSVSHMDDGNGDYESTVTKKRSLKNLSGLSDETYLSNIMGDILVIDGKVAGAILFVENGGYYPRDKDYVLPLKRENAEFAVFYIDGRVEGYGGRHFDHDCSVRSSEYYNTKYTLKKESCGE